MAIHLTSLSLEVCGTAGCVLANRLSANSKYKVLVLEAGSSTPDDVLESRIPLLNSRLKNTDVDWKLQSTCQSNADDRVISIPLGKMLGGCSSFNACLHHRCSPSDYDAWNVKGWTYDELRPYFCKAESFHDASVDENIHGTAGPLHATQADLGLLGKYFKEACKEIGLQEHYDVTDEPCQIGVTRVQASIYRGERSSTGACYLSKETLKHQPNLTIAMGCHVYQILFDNKRAHSVEFKDRNESTFTVNVGREVILSLGAIFSPYLLLKSGIGPKDELARHGIPTIMDLPGVGKNLQNHWRIPLVHETVEPEMSLHRDLFINRDVALKQALDQKNGAFTRIWPDAVAYLKIPDTPDNSSHIKNTPQIELFTGGLALCNHLASLKEVNSATLLMVYLAPFSRGSITLSDKQALCVDLGLLQDGRDMECLEKGLRLSFSIANHPTYKESCVKRWILPSKDMNDIDVKQYIKEHVETIHHYAGTCKMGTKDDLEAVVDDHLKIHGIENVRVVDASFFPIVPAGQICFPVIACAEKAADMILNDNENCTH
ncbi:hypothetical protein G6F57_000141 [Rhizopus arrhizus]|uniref:Glucose-methanol-choline oxidoreductase N-terminal domain-containing protein n=1 Tax=Rhizopus oryzae TaxID=64495 RepID=A0A9P6XL55_RHIOR|nr:hypothetical protein G6F23_002774 [Rhizopus arrhizus]KAG1425279.1 hypothetical protein G6F58_001999 [Rhizopus delemar]KAG0761357.1 hypothetical protein G6F24_007631 [Rhizopus arrhizus]KAG0791292.1 hypothetical protein G6F22_006174 [Rhizopus arrhizus]KAG0797294.1 hypothetical protein G6F21_000640 [Rhizopus arrhizus]